MDWPAVEVAELAIPVETAFELLLAVMTVVVTWLELWLMVVRWLNEPTNTLSASRSGRTSPVWASSSCMLSSDMMLPFFFLFRFPIPTACGHRGVCAPDLGQARTCRIKREISHDPMVDA